MADSCDYCGKAFTKDDPEHPTIPGIHKRCYEKIGEYRSYMQLRGKNPDAGYDDTGSIASAPGVAAKQ